MFRTMPIFGVSCDQNGKTYKNSEGFDRFQIIIITLVFDKERQYRQLVACI